MKQWSKEVIEKDLDLIEKNFTDIVNHVYEEKFVDNIFTDFVSTIKREHFVEALTEKP